MDKISLEEFKKEFERIEEVQKQVSKILCNKNWLVRTFMLPKAWQLYSEYTLDFEILKSKIIVLESGEEISIQEIGEGL